MLNFGMNTSLGSNLFTTPHRYRCSIKTIQRRLDRHSVSHSIPKEKFVIVLMDTTYWGMNFGVMLFKDVITKNNLLKYYVKHETNGQYIQGVEELKKEGFPILVIVCDGRKGLIQSFDGTPVQIFQFHQCAIIRRYIIKKSKLAEQELMEVVNKMKKTDRKSFTGALAMWFEKWNSFLSERTFYFILTKYHSCISKKPFFHVQILAGVISNRADNALSVSISFKASIVTLALKVSVGLHRIFALIYGLKTGVVFFLTSGSVFGESHNYTS